jgi:hypothetical protein
MSGAATALQAAAIAALDGIEGLNGAYPAPPLQAAAPYALVECGAEGDWGHKSGKGRELRLAVTLRDEGERPERVQALADAVEGAIEAGLSPVGWRLVTLTLLRVRGLGPARGGGPAILIEYRARLLAEP